MLVYSHLEKLGDKVIVVKPGPYVQLPRVPNGERWFFPEHKTTAPNFNATRLAPDVRWNEKPRKLNMYTNGYMNSQNQLAPTARESTVNNWFYPEPDFTRK